MWRIYYADGSTLDHPEVPRGELARGIQAILQHDRDLGWLVLSEGDYYIWRDGRWWATDLNGLWDFLVSTGLVLYGRTISSRKFKEILNEALDERARRRELDGAT